jgi:hypothetical protein
MKKKKKKRAVLPRVACVVRERENAPIILSLPVDPSLMLAPFAPHPKTDTSVVNSYEGLSAPCLLKGTDAAIQLAKKPSKAHVRPDSDDGLIREGSHVILFATRDNINSIIVKRNAVFDNKHGHFYHNDLIGKPFGSRVCT